jgi:hypothetical protein
MPSLREEFSLSWLPLRSFYLVSLLGVRGRLFIGLAEIIPQLMFYTTHGISIFTLFSVINDKKVSQRSLIIFFLYMCCVDSVGDALFFKGLGEYCMALRKRFPVYHLLSPGNPLLLCLFLRADIPMIIFGFLFGLAGFSLSWYWAGVQAALISVPLLIFGIFTHTILTSAFHILQAWIDPRMPIAYGSPASRFYTKPLHLALNSGLSLAALVLFYPAFLMTALPAGVAAQDFRAAQLASSWYLIFAAGSVSIAVWFFVLNRIVVRSAKKWS